MFADLHLHTLYSDGTWPPEELAARAAAAGLGAVALTDHDTVEGCREMAAASRARGLEFLAGTELTAEHEGREIHLLGYCMNPEDPTLLAAMRQFQAARQERIRRMVARLNELGLPLTADTVFELANCRSPGRPHVARALVQAGLCDSMDEAFERFLKQDRPAWAPKFRISTTEAIRLIHQAGGVAVMAHPGLTRADEAILPMAAAGLDGLECFHTKHTPATSRHYLQLAEERSLLVTGGSDCHGLNKGKPLVGSVRVPRERVEAVKARAAERKSSLLRG